MVKKLFPEIIIVCLVAVLFTACSGKEPRSTREFRLLQNDPNPSNAETWIPYELATDAIVTISIHNVEGKIVRTIALGKQKAGSYITKDKAAYWDCTDEAGQPVNSGVYFYQMKAGDFTATHKMVVVK